MESAYKTLGSFTRLVDERNRSMTTTRILGINIDKYFMPSVANTIGTDLSNYKLLRKGLFACNPMHVGRDERLPIALYTDDIPAIVSPAYFVFEITDNSVLAEYLMMWFLRPDFDRLCWFKTDASVRGGIAWDDLSRIEIPIPPIDAQRKLVYDYKVISDRIALKRRINDNLESQLREIIVHRISWETCPLMKLKDCATMQYGYTQTATAQEIGPKFLRITDISRNYIDWTDVPYCICSPENYKKYELHEGDIVVARTGATAGYAKMLGSNIPNAVFASFLVRIQANNPIYRHYLGLEVTSKNFLTYVQLNAEGSAQQQANPPLLGEYALRWPSIQCLEDLEQAVSLFLIVKEHNELEISALKEMRSLLL